MSKPAKEARQGYKVQAKRMSHQAKRSPMHSISTATALQFQSIVPPDGNLSIQVPLPGGTRVIVFVVQPTVSEFADLEYAAQSSLAFWDNPIDDAEWNNA